MASRNAPLARAEDAAVEDMDVEPTPGPSTAPDHRRRQQQQHPHPQQHHQPPTEEVNPEALEEPTRQPPGKDPATRLYVTAPGGRPITEAEWVSWQVGFDWQLGEAIDRTPEGEEELRVSSRAFNEGRGVIWCRGAHTVDWVRARKIRAGDLELEVNSTSSMRSPQFSFNTRKIQCPLQDLEGRVRRKLKALNRVLPGECWVIKVFRSRDSTLHFTVACTAEFRDAMVARGGLLEFGHFDTFAQFPGYPRFGPKPPSKPRVEPGSGAASARGGAVSGADTTRSGGAGSSNGENPRRADVGPRPDKARSDGGVRVPLPQKPPDPTKITLREALLEPRLAAFRTEDGRGMRNPTREELAGLRQRRKRYVIRALTTLGLDIPPRLPPPGVQSPRVGRDSSPPEDQTSGTREGGV